MNYYDQIKGLLISNEVYKRVKDYSKNRSDLDTYYNVGKLLVEAQGGETRAKYGVGLIKEYSKRLSIELNDKKYSYRNLMNMRKFYIMFNNTNVNALRSQLSWSHYRILLKIKNIQEIEYYINLAINSNLGYRELDKRIKSNEYESLSKEAKNKLIKKEEPNLIELVPNPIIVNNKNNYDVINEKILQQLILEDMPSFLDKLGSGYAFIKNEYKIKIGDNYNYIDLLLYNIKNRCYVVVELKVTELKKEHIGQIQVYMNYIDKNIKTIEENNTIGIIICKHNNEYIIGYSSDERIISREYEII